MKTLCIGMMIGAGLALLYAPATGARTRSLIRDRANKLANGTTDFVDKKKRHLSNKVQGYKAKMQHAADQMSSRFEDRMPSEPLGVGGRF